MENEDEKEMVLKEIEDRPESLTAENSIKTSDGAVIEIKEGGEENV